MARDRYSDQLMRRLKNGQSMPLAAFSHLPPARPIASQATRAAPPKRGEPLIGYPINGDLGPRQALVTANFEFLEAAAKEDRKAMLVAVNHMLSGAMMACGIENPFIEAPGLAVVQSAIEDALSGKTPRLFQAVPRTDDKAPPRRPGSEWIAVAGILLCAAIYKKLHNVGLETALSQAIVDLENDLGIHVDDCLEDVKAEGDADRGMSTNRVDSLATRFKRNHVEDLSKEKTPAGRSRAGVLYRKGLATIESQSLESLQRQNLYVLTRSTTANFLRYARAVRDEKVKPKGGKGRRLEKDD